MAAVFLAIANIPMYVVMGWALFGSWSKFGEAVWGIGEDYEYAREGWEDRWWLQMKLLFLIVCCAALVFAEYHGWLWIAAEQEG